jgi:uncharacterized membrane protein
VCRPIETTGAKTDTDQITVVPRVARVTGCGKVCCRPRQSVRKNRSSLNCSGWIFVAYNRRFTMITIDKSIDIKAPIAQVYTFWQNFENFAEFIGSVESIKRTGENKSHWVVLGPLRTKVEFDALTTENIVNDSIKWHSVHEQDEVEQVKSEGSLKFKETDGTTQVHLTFSYSLPNAIANKVAETMNALGFPQKDFDKGLETIKTKIEGDA